MVGEMYIEGSCGQQYRVVLNEQGNYRCSCPHFVYRLAATGMQCKHILAAIEKGLKTEEKKGMTREEARWLIACVASTRIYCTKWEVVGGWKRGKTTIHDLDILVACTPKGWMDLQSCMIEEKDAIRKRGGDHLVIFDLGGKQIDFHRAEVHQWGSALCHHTGSADENERLRKIAKEVGWKLNQYGIDDAEGKHHDFATEEEVYAFLKQPYKKPEERG